jgi:hypothetical protein
LHADCATRNRDDIPAKKLRKVSAGVRSSMQDDIDDWIVKDREASNSTNRLGYSYAAAVASYQLYERHWLRLKRLFA